MASNRLMAKALACFGALHGVEGNLIEGDLHGNRPDIVERHHAREQDRRKDHVAFAKHFESGVVPHIRRSRAAPPGPSAPSADFSAEDR